jgi:hypothetical protein
MDDVDQTVRYWWSPPSSKGPYSSKVLEFTESSITFDGYFYEDEDNLPVQRILKLLVPDRVEGHTTHLKQTAIYHIEIIEKIEGKDTSVYTPPNPEDPHDEDAGICFFPTHHVTLRFRILQKDFDKEEENRIYAAWPKKQKGSA